MFNSVFFFIVFLQMTGRIECGDREDEEELLFLKNFTRIHCYKLKSCSHDGGKVCGHDDRSGITAYFTDECYLYRTNCNMEGVYNMVNITMCDTTYQKNLAIKDKLQFENIFKNVFPHYTNKGGDTNNKHVKGQRDEISSVADKT